MPRFAANLEFLFPELPFLERFAAAASAGFKAVEMRDACSYSVDQLETQLSRNRLELVLFNCAMGDWKRGEKGIAAIGGREQECESDVRCAIEYAVRLGCGRLHLMSGLESHGASIDGLKHNLRRLAPLAAEAGILLLLEPINTRDMPGYLLHSTTLAREIIDSLESENIRLQLDLYHCSVMGGDVFAALHDYRDITQHIQIASPRDRGEPDRGELDYEMVLQRIDALGYDGFVGCEYHPRGDTLHGLSWVQSLGYELDSGFGL